MAEQIVGRDDLVRVDEFTYDVPMSYRSDMRVPARVFVNEKMLDDVTNDRSLWQLVNMTTLPGIKNYAFAMPDVHQGYGFPVGGVAATAIDEGGVISPGGIGYDINCGVRLLASNMTVVDLQPRMDELATALFQKIPSGVGRGGKLDYGPKELDKILQHGAQRMFDLGFGEPGDIEFCEERGCMEIANPSLISEHAKKRGSDQLGTLGSGNHFLEVQVVDEIYDKEVAATFGLTEGYVVIMIHTGSRGLGHQTCTDYVRAMMQKLPEWGYELPDRELIYAPFNSPDGQAYFHAMAAAANYGWANRHMITHWTREAWREQLGNDAVLNLVYDISHNMGKKEKHVVDGQEMNLLVHRKGATRSFGPGRPELPARYKATGHPVLVPGTMGTSSHVLVGTEAGMQVAFGSCCHGAGRRMSRSKAKKHVHGANLRQQLEARGILIRCASDPGLAEEAPLAYKDVENVVDVVAGAGLARKVARVKPLAVIKGG